MPIYTLDIDEAVILQASRVSTGTFGTADLILTNKNLIQVNKGILGGDKDCIKYPLANLKVLNGKANIIIGKSRNGSKQLELYFTDCEKYFSFNSPFAESKWAGAITKAHKEYMAELKKSTADKESLVESFKGALSGAKDAIFAKKIPVRKTCKCLKCGAELTGNKGEMVKCPYCDNDVVIK